MKKSLGFALFFLLFGASSAMAAEITASSQISKVTVYQDRALVTRQGRLELPEGPSQILIEGLPGALIEESLRASGKGSASVTLNGVELKRLFAPQEANPRIQEVTAALEKLIQDQRQLGLEQQALNEQRDFLNSIKNFTAVQIPKDLITKNPSATEWASLSQFLYQSYNEIGQKTLALEKALQDKSREIQSKQQELKSLQRGQGIEKKTAVVLVETKAKTSFVVELSYLVPQAAWSLSYDAKVYPDKQECFLTSYGNVRQWTGEDWNDVSLTLSSARPAIGGHMPELSPWFVNFQEIFASARRQYSPMQGLAKNAAMADSASADRMVSEKMEYDKPAALAEASISQDLGSVSYQIERPSTVLSDNRLNKTPIKTESLKTALDYQGTPKLSPTMFIHSKVTNDKNYPIVAGPLNVFVNDNYIGQSSIRTIGTGEEFDLYLGIDEEVKVKRVELKDKSKKTLLGLRSRKDYAYKFEIENYKKETIQVSILDQIPVSKNAEIKAELVSSSLKPSKMRDLGIIEWTLSLAPKEKKEFEFQFFVEHPSDKPVSGV